MKKQFQILAATFITMAIVSCTKERMDMQQTPQTNEEIVTSNSSSGGLVINPLNVNLEGSFQFDNNLKDQTKKLADGIPTTRVATYTTDRKGNLKSALYFDSTYGIKIKSVPQQTHTSLSVWIKPAHVWASGLSYIAAPSAYGPVMNHISNLLSGGVVMNSTIPGGTFYFNNTGWRHLVVTYDGVDLKFYVNGVLVDTNNEPGYIPTSVSEYFIGYLIGFNKWKGGIDDLRFYSRTLTPTDVQKLYNL